MNKERILELADYVEGLDHVESFYVTENVDFSARENPNPHQTRPFHMDHCKQCLIGQAGVLFASSLPATQYWSSLYAEEVLGLDTLISQQLFFPALHGIESPGNMLGHITPKSAAVVLRNLVETGRVEWPQRTFEEFCQSDSQHSFDLS